jgi:DNA gyrase/topoisomerase IV subunit B
MAEIDYSDDSIRSLDWKEHIRLRPGMYIGKLGDGLAYDDGIYVLLKEILDNSIDEFVMGSGKTIEITVSDKKVSIRDYGRGIPLGKVIDCVSKINTGGKYDSKAFQKSVGLNGVGTKAVNALSSNFMVQSYRDGRTKKAEFEQGVLVNDLPEIETTQRNGTAVVFYADDTIFRNYRYIPEFVESMIWNYVFLNSGLKKSLTALSSSPLFSSAVVKPMVCFSLSAAPRLDVNTIIEFLQSAFLPLDDVIVPSSIICNKILLTSGCAFSISSINIIELGFFSISLINNPPPRLPSS